MQLQILDRVKILTIIPDADRPFLIFPEKADINAVFLSVTEAMLHNVVGHDFNTQNDQRPGF